MSIALMDFLLTKTNAGELCVIRDYGYAVACAYIDYEDMFRIPREIYARAVQADSWGTVRIKDGKGGTLDIPCHYVDIKYDADTSPEYVCEACGKRLDPRDLACFYEANLCEKCATELGCETYLPQS